MYLTVIFLLWENKFTSANIVCAVTSISEVQAWISWCFEPSRPLGIISGLLNGEDGQGITVSKEEVRRVLKKKEDKSRPSCCAWWCSTQVVGIMRRTSLIKFCAVSFISCWLSVRFLLHGKRLVPVPKRKQVKVMNDLRAYLVHKEVF